MPRGEERYQDIENQLITWLVNSNGEGYRREFLCLSGVKPNSLTDVQERLREADLIRIESRDRKHFYLLTSKGREYAAASNAKSFGERYGLPVYVSEYLEKKRSKKITQLWPLQEKYVESRSDEDENLFICGPPASGKTLIAEIETLRELKKGMHSKKVLYCTPFKALDRQKEKDFHDSFSGLGFRVVTTDGDHPSTPQILQRADIVIATYERILMALKNEEKWLRNLTLVCANELTILDEEDRGGNIDLVLTLLKERYKVRVVALSSLVGNPHQIRDWLDARMIVGEKTLGVEEMVVYSEGKEIVFLGADGKEKTERLIEEENILTHILAQNLQNDETTLVFFPGRQHTKLFANALSQIHAKHLSQEEFRVLEKASTEMLQAVEEETPLLRELVQLMKYGLAFHHAGLPFEARKEVEDLLEERHVKTICSTTTLSHGIDYPVDNVIIAFFFVDSRTWEFDRYSYTKKYSYVQIKGRSGRPDKSKGFGRVFLLARNKDEATGLWQKYLFKVSLENISSHTLSNENIAKLVLLEANKDDGTNVDEIASVLAKTFDARTKSTDVRIIASTVLNVISDLGQFGLVVGKRRLKITRLGKEVNTLTQSPYDAQLVVRSIKDKKTSDFQLIFIACSTGFAKDVRDFNVTTVEAKKLKTIARKLNVDLQEANINSSSRRALILTEYIQEEKVGSLTDKYAYFNDNDVYELSRYASRSMYEIAKMARKTGRYQIAKKAELLAQRITYGVKQDLIESRLVLLPEVGRVRGRRLLDAGMKGPEDVAKSTRLKIINTAKVNAETAIQIQEFASTLARV